MPSTSELLCIGIKRGKFRDNDATAKQADAVFETQRLGALQSAQYRCERCGYESSVDLKKNRHSVLHIHHKDDNHHNNEPENFIAYCSLDHAYHHIGCDAPSVGGARGWASQMRIAFVPEIASEDMNHLQRAIGAALTDPTEKEVATQMMDLLSILSLPVRDGMGSSQSKDFAAAFGSMSEKEYEDRLKAVEGLRVLFHPDLLKQVGNELLIDSPLFSVNSWEGIGSGFGI